MHISPPSIKTLTLCHLHTILFPAWGYPFPGGFVFFVHWHLMAPFVVVGASNMSHGCSQGLLQKIYPDLDTKRGNRKWFVKNKWRITHHRNLHILDFTTSSCESLAKNTSHVKVWLKILHMQTSVYEYIMLKLLDRKMIVGMDISLSFPLVQSNSIIQPYYFMCKQFT